MSLPGPKLLETVQSTRVNFGAVLVALGLHMWRSGADLALLHGGVSFTQRGVHAARMLRRMCS